MQIEMRATESVTPYDHNPRRNDEAVEAVARSIREFGFRQPIVVDADGVIVVGHTRWKAAQRLGLATVPVHVAGELTAEQARAYRIADNQSAQIAEWDPDLLAQELTGLKALDYDLSLLGFSDAELSEWMAPPANEGVAPADEVPDTPEDPITQPGDLWVLGAHRLLCGDSTKAADVDRLMDGNKAALVATDPPYLVDYTGERPGGADGNSGGKDWSATYREVDITDADGFFRGVFTNVVRVIAPHAAIYCWHAHKRQALIARVWEDLGILDHQQVIWVKPTAVFGRVFWH
ncbi:MAG: ParB N-terminal domain-containing protein, partial [Phycisphaerales bacterium]|nr:ParB N-terminal domain-containing protein [Phycisphaerales bacterium]